MGSSTLAQYGQVAWYYVLSHPFIFAIVFTVLYLLSNKYKRGLQNIPGPTLASYSALWRLHDVWAGDSHNTAIKLHDKYGKLVRIAPNVVSVADPEEINTIYGLKSTFTKTAFYPIQCISWNKKPQPNLFSTRDAAYHKEQKRKVANAFALSSLLDMEPAVDSCTKLLMEKLDHFAKSSTPVDLGMWMQYYAFDVVGELCFAEKLGFLDKGGDVDKMIETIEGILNYASLCGQVPEWHPFLLGNPLFPHLFPQMETWNSVLTFTLKAINKRTKVERNGELTTNDTNGMDMLSKWAKVKGSDPDKMSTRDIMVHLSTNVFAGSDTTAIAFKAIIYYLLKNPDKFAKFIKELDDAIDAGMVSDPITFKESNTHLPYMDAVIKEAIRMHPSVGLLLERHVPKGGMTICGTHFAEGTIVGINAWVLHYDEKVFPEPYKFLPERWIESTPEHLKEMNKSWFAFGAGARSCVGKNISIMEMKKAVPQLYRNFSLSLADPKKEWKTKNSWFVQQSDVIINLERRENSNI